MINGKNHIPRKDSSFGRWCSRFHPADGGGPIRHVRRHPPNPDAGRTNHSKRKTRQRPGKGRENLCSGSDGRQFVCPLFCFSLNFLRRTHLGKGHKSPERKKIDLPFHPVHNLPINLWPESNRKPFDDQSRLTGGPEMPKFVNRHRQTKKKKG